MLAVGAAVGVATGFLTSWWYAGVAGWIAACLLYTSWVWLHLYPLDADGMRTHATREDPGAVVSDVLIVSASIASLAAVAIILVRASRDQGGTQAAVAALAVTSVALSWFLVHTLYAQRYAREYYRNKPEGGIEFVSDTGERPVFSDFLYLAFDLGMTYQISDTPVRTRRLRAIVLRHTLLSYLFGTVILASTINLVVGLGS
jgi:uncharacterized membrane protein